MKLLVVIAVGVIVGGAILILLAITLTKKM